MTMKPDTSQPGQTKGSRRFALAWGVCIGVLLCLGLLCWFLVGPMLQTHAALGRYSPQTMKQEIASLGGQRKAIILLQRYTAFPRWLATRKGTAVAMLGFCGEDAVPALIELLDHENREVREEAVNALGRLQDPRAVSALSRLMLTEQGRLGAGAAWALGEIKDRRAISPLIKALSHSKPLTRELAAESLGKLGAVEALPRLRSLLKDNDEAVRKAAEKSIEGLRGSPSAHDK